jgi:hypothetical protein
MPSLDKMSQVSGMSMPHTGEMIGAVLQERHVSDAQLSRLLDVPASAVGRYHQQHTIHAALLWKIGLVLEHNFFADLAAAFPKAGVSVGDREKDLEAQVADLQRQLADAQKENAVYLKVLGVLGKKGE